MLTTSDEYTPRLKPLIKDGDQVMNQHGVEGKVILNGPYGDEPFQVLSENGGYFSNVSDQGKSDTSDLIWSKTT
jgi:hypothetical protein